jgi:hypothetical protein
MAIKQERATTASKRITAITAISQEKKPPRIPNRKKAFSAI